MKRRHRGPTWTVNAAAPQPWQIRETHEIFNVIRGGEASCSRWSDATAPRAAFWEITVTS